MPRDTEEVRTTSIAPPPWTARRLLRTANGRMWQVRWQEEEKRATRRPCYGGGEETRNPAGRGPASRRARFKWIEGRDSGACLMLSI